MAFHLPRNPTNNCLLAPISTPTFVLSLPLTITRSPVLLKSHQNRPILVSRKRQRRANFSAVTDVEPPAPQQKTEQNLAAENSKLDLLLEPRDKRRYVFFGGKGGVGKTSTSASVAVRCADAGLSTLVISTDPAHSLGDALRYDLSDGCIHQVDDTIPLYAIESDTRQAVDKFRQLVASLKSTGSSSDSAKEDTVTEKDIDKKGDPSGWAAVAERLGLQEFSDVLETIPPGADELIALVAVLDLVETENPDLSFDRIIIDTAPTGHTLRLLSFPDFLDKFLSQALSLRRKLASARGVIGTVSNLFMGGRKQNVDGALDAAADRVSAYRDKMIALAQLFRDPSRSEFVVVTIATGLAVAESRRLIDKLWDEGIWVRHVVVNQLVPPEREDVLNRYLERVRKGQAREISFATEQIADEYGLTVSLVPRFDSEVRGVYGLQALAKVAFREPKRASYSPLFDTSMRATSENDTKGCQFVFVGGKGGVGKTSLSAALGTALAAEGLKTLVLSTDPAHSIGDAFQQSVDGGGAVEIVGAEGELYAMEVDSEGAVKDFQRLAREYVSEGRRGVGADIARKLGLEDFANLLDNAPPGIDELVALTEVIELVKFGDFDRVIVDTAPTGHTLRLLSFPEFLESFLGKIIRLKQRLDKGIEALKSVLGRREGSADAVDRAAKGVDRLRKNMGELRELVADDSRTQFAIVTVPTGLAMAESERLAKSLKKDGVAVNNLIINQVVPEGEGTAFVNRVVSEQVVCLKQVAEICKQWGLVTVRAPFFDTEVRGVYGLRAMAGSLFTKPEE